MIKVDSELKIHEIDGKDEPPVGCKKLHIHSHWNRNELVLIEFPGLAPVTVSARDLRAAIDNATNSGRL